MVTSEEAPCRVMAPKATGCTGDLRAGLWGGGCSDHESAEQGLPPGEAKEALQKMDHKFWGLLLSAGEMGRVG